MKEIRLTQGKIALIDDEDFSRVSAYKWYAHRCSRSRCGAYYAQRSVHSGPRPWTVCLHRFVLDIGPGVMVDHKNHDTLDCRKANLRISSNNENRANSIKNVGASRFKGVSRNHGRGWTARIRKNGILIRLGEFSSEEEAAVAYDQAAVRYHGEFSRTNAVLGLFKVTS